MKHRSQKRSKEAEKRPQPAPPSPTAKQTHWADVADWYDRVVGDEGSEYHRHVVFPGALKLLAPQPADHILDIACGQGAFCRFLHAQGLQTTGVDAAQPLIDLARKHNDKLPAPVGSASADAAALQPNYFIGDARNLNFLPQSAFTAATCLLAIQNIDELPPVFAGVHRALAPGGKLILVMMHPAFRGPKYSHWGWDDESKTQYRRIDRYLLPRKDPIFTHPGKKTGQYTWSFHRPLQTYVKSLAKAGLFIDALEEWPSHKSSEPGPRSAAENTARREIPMFLAIRAIKVGATSLSEAKHDGSDK